MWTSNRVYLRRRLAALGILAAASALAGAAVGAGDRSRGQTVGDGSAAASAAKSVPKLAELPRGGRRIFPEFRVVAFYGAPQARSLGALGIGSPDAAGRRLARQAAPYAKRTRPILPAFELLADVANRDPGPDGLYRTRQPDSVIRRYLRAARRAKALLVLDIQPGHADFLEETRHLDRWLREPDVGLALDPEWHTPGAVPGTVIGSVDADTTNAVSRHVADIVRERNLPEKLLVVHQFTPNMIAGKERVQQPPGLAVTMNVDGFGDRPNKVSKYREFTHDGTPFHRGFKLFYEEDTDLMTPGSVLALQPRPDLIVYE
ncbi:MAG: hypothetical protein QOI62_1298 [Solirubrobacteraceae bacterium]|jgi:hypothetical protein|nr:hypothetical protein [Solirubrobacteraceae bacterium]